ncbi:MAG: hypothetical protein P8P74_14860 [Crocinitomicaceae bacterium]|nr:hypothetical protein [Crocinitomicaceae bacterium]
MSILFLALIAPALALSQSDTTKKSKFILASLSFEMGPMLDRYSNVDLEMMYDWTSNPTEIERDLTDHTENFERDVSGSKVGVSIALIPFNNKEIDYSTIGELRFGLFYKVRGTYLSYFRSDTSSAYKSVGYSTRFKELSLHSSYVWKYNPKFAERFTLHAGIGIGLGSTFSDETSVAEIISSGQAAEIPNSLFQKYQGKSSFFFRPFVPIGIDFALSDRFDVGIQSYFGMAMQQVYRGETYTIPISGSVVVKLSYFF